MRTIEMKRTGLSTFEVTYTVDGKVLVRTTVVSYANAKNYVDMLKLKDWRAKVKVTL